MSDTQSSKSRFYYQPTFLASISSWSWTLLILVMGVIFWLEVTHFNWITALFFILFIVVLLVQGLTRTILIQDHQLIINRTLQKNWLVINISDLRSLQATKTGIKFIYNSGSRRFYLTKKQRQQLFQTIGEINKNHEVNK
ncbi:EbsA family protein [Pediococcus damnosus]|uniref:Pore-forming protein n=2 Tax=Pediococcus damnosus TaxID=51663 RepID=A0AAC9B0K2_9LACO|nr:EbsA family protein [Pediococcus damnosus]AMV62129.1 pore-forming protein [Pediococcus damnosus]AMV65868.1 pore-forming protein [Pediococcus damnosus]AMV70208.1 pore-forming protein [Pediococcus damnosus]KJU74037.1 pore-forming protein [Pediococcus damnosus LMG 28219]KRN52614.1 hypothetical protein IV84_GL000582 [Pediococcus damnosus]